MIYTAIRFGILRYLSYYTQYTLILLSSNIGRYEEAKYHHPCGFMQILKIKHYDQDDSRSN